MHFISPHFIFPHFHLTLFHLTLFSITLFHLTKFHLTFTIFQVGLRGKAPTPSEDTISAAETGSGLLSVLVMVAISGYSAIYFEAML